MNQTQETFEQEAAEVAENSFLRSALAACSCLILFLWFSSSACAHELRPAYLELRQTGPETYDALWKVPGLGENLRLGLYVELPGGSTNLTRPRASMINNAYTERWTVKRPGGLAGGTISIAGLSATMTDVLVRLQHLEGRTQVLRLTPSAPAFVVEAAPRAMQVAMTYLKLGIEHILGGVDHLLFVLALLFITRGTRDEEPGARGTGGSRSSITRHSRLATLNWPLLKTITAFTVAHSITLALATLGFVRVPPAPVEAVIALSILFVAAEILRTRSAGFSPLPCSPGRSAARSSGVTSPVKLRRAEVRVPSLTARAPWVVAFTFGLLHGFGFASALNEIGLPQNSIPMALLLFNVGVELGQILFVAAVCALVAALGRVRATWPSWVEALPPYAIGGCAAFWVIQRIAAF